METQENIELLAQWEPQVQKMLQNTFVLGKTKEDIAQELRMAVLKADKYFDESRGVKFHTFLTTVMVNTIRTLIAKAKKNKDLLEAYSIQGNSNITDEDWNTNTSIDLEDTSANDYLTDLELADILKRAKVNKLELEFIELRKNGVTMEQISKKLNDSAYKIRLSIQNKVRPFFEDLIDEKKTT